MTDNRSFPDSGKALSTYRNFHRGETILVCGCGASLNDHDHPENFLTIGVNDVGRLFTPDYLVVLNPPNQFSGDRFQYVQTSKAKALFTQLDLPIRHPNIVRFPLGKRRGADWASGDHLHYARNSPYVALQLALYMGAARVGLVGVDFTENHFFAKTGRHALTARLSEINREYAAVQKLCERRGVEVINLSPQSRLEAFPKQTLAEFERSAGSQPFEPAFAPAPPGAPLMRIAIEKHSPGLLGDFFETLAASCEKLGHPISRDPRAERASPQTLSIVWNGRRHRSAGPTLYCEHGWLPRSQYQISPRGINADSHLAPFSWVGQALSSADSRRLEKNLAEIREGAGASLPYMQTDAPARDDLPENFYLVPLQIESDTNIQRHVEARYRRMQDLVEHLSAANPPYPVIYKQHPADIRHGNRHKRLRMRRKSDSLRLHTEGNIHQLLKSGRCRGVVALNSNVLHDALLWGVPGVALGRNVWPAEQPSPFLLTLPNDWEQLGHHYDDPEIEACRQAYMLYLIENQWSLDDARDMEKVALLLHSLKPSNLRSFPPTAQPVRRPRTHINVVARNKGWFFEDLKSYYRAATSGSLIVTTSEHPRPDADSWIFLRAKEAAATPDPARTLVQIHDLYRGPLYGEGAERGCVAACAAIALTHPAQREFLESEGVSLDEKLLLDRPIGPPSSFRLRHRLPKKFTIAWVGRPSIYQGEDVSRIEWFLEAVQDCGLKPEVILLGDRLEKAGRELQKAGIACRALNQRGSPFSRYPHIYASFDCLVSTAKFEPGPQSLYEALACGIPVIATPEGQAGAFLRNGENGFLAESPVEIAKALRHIHSYREVWFARRKRIRQSIEPLTLESWIDHTLALARKLVRQKAA